MNDLTHLLTEAAEEMTGTQYETLRGRVDDTSRRLGRQRAVLVSLAGVVAVGAIVAGTVQLLPRAHNSPGPGASTTVTNTGPAPSPTGTAPSTTPPAAGPVTAVQVPGTWTYLDKSPGKPLQVVRRMPRRSR